MHEETDDLETVLRRWRPRDVRGELTRRISSELETPPTPPQTWWRALGFSHPLAAYGWGLAVPALVVLTTLLATSASAPVAPARTQTSESPVIVNSWRAAGATNRRLETNDEGVVLDASQRPVRRVRYRSEDTVAWHNSETGALLEVSYPREDVVTVPVTMR